MSIKSAIKRITPKPLWSWLHNIYVNTYISPGLSHPTTAEPLNSWLHHAKKYFTFWIQYHTNKLIPEFLYPKFYPKSLKRWYVDRTGEELNLEHPQSFNEKLQWLKLNDSTPFKGRLADKYLVRGYIKEQIGPDYLVPLLGVWDDPSEIDFDALPDRFFLKATHSSGRNMYVSNKEQLDKKETLKTLHKWLRWNYGFSPKLELQYRYCEPRIIAEPELEEPTGPGSILGGVVDYKCYIFNTSHVVIAVYVDRNLNEYAKKVAYYDASWSKLDISEKGRDSNFEVEKPKVLNEMIALSRKLACDFPFVRVDWFVIEGKLYFGEITFTPYAGAIELDPPRWDAIFGSWIELPLNDDERATSEIASR